MVGRLDDAIGAAANSWQEEFPEQDASPVLLFIRLGYLARHLQRFHDAVLRPQGRTLTEYQVLATLRMNGPQTPTDLNGLVMLTRAGMTNTLDRLERARLLKRRADDSDGRSIRVRLTAAGTRHAERLLLAQREAQQDLLGGIGRDEQPSIERALATLTDAFEAHAIDNVGEKRASGSRGKP